VLRQTCYLYLVAQFVQARVAQMLNQQEKMSWQSETGL